jgi:hypothetical protein
VAVAVMDEPAPAVLAGNRVHELEQQIASLQQKLRVRDTALRTILEELDELRARVSAELRE